MKRRRGVLLLMSSVVLVATALAAGQSFPNRPIRIVVAYPPGGQADSVARLTAQKLGEILGGSVIVENRPGGNATIGAELVARAPADGYTLLLGGAANLTIAPALDSQLRYDTLRDFEAVGRVARVPQLLAVRATLPITTVSQLVEYAKQNPGKLTFASPAASNELAIESLKAAAGLDITHRSRASAPQYRTRVDGGCNGCHGAETLSHLIQRRIPPAQTTQRILQSTAAARFDVTVLSTGHK